VPLFLSGYNSLSVKGEPPMTLTGIVEIVVVAIIAIFVVRLFKKRG
jgi:hypothetical protein